MKTITCRLVFAAALTGVFAASIANATPMYTFSLLTTFNSANGGNPSSGLIADASGNLYGTTSGSGGNGFPAGTVYEIASGTHALATLATFPFVSGYPYGAFPIGDLAFDANGNLYGTAEHGGQSYGTFFEVAAGTHALTAPASFNGTNGLFPLSGLIADASGNLYGTTQQGGIFGSDGTVFEVAAGTHAITSLFSFNGTDGKRPDNGLAIDASGNLYGTTSSGGTGGGGTIFEVAAGTHAVTTLVSFDSTNNAEPNGLILDQNGNIYGTTQTGGANTVGTIFEVAAGSHVLTTLISLTGPDSFPAAGLVLDSRGDLFGTSQSGGDYGDGSVFELPNGADAVTTLYSFNMQGASGGQPDTSLFLDSSGNLFGTTPIGGANQEGTLFELSPVPEPSSIALNVLAFGGLAFLILTKRRSRSPIVAL